MDWGGRVGERGEMGGSGLVEEEGRSSTTDAQNADDSRVVEEARCGTGREAERVGMGGSELGRRGRSEQHH